MHAYEFILVLLSFVYAAAVTHPLSTAGEIIIASKRIRLSWVVDEGPKYLFAYAIVSLLTIITNAGLGPGGSSVQWSTQNVAIVPMTIATIFAAIFIRTRWVQAAAVAIQILGWLWYFARFQSALTE